MLRLEYNIYCDESCHLPNDNNQVMALGAGWCPTAKKREISSRLREIKVRHGFKPDFEIKWNKVSPAGISFYMDIINYFFDNDDVHFRALVVPNKNELDHEAFNQDHDTFYYKMYFSLLKVILSPDHVYNIYIDIKDTKSQEKVNKLQDVLRNNHYDYHKQIIRKIQQVRSHEVEILQITDILTGAISYLHRGLSANAGKMALIDRIKKRSDYSLTRSTLYKENKFNLFIWNPRVV